MASLRGNLKPAHSGYRYQDIATAYFLISSLLGKYDSVTVDKKQVEDDRLDDLEVSKSGIIYRTQIKSSPNINRAIKRADFTGVNSTLRIDRLVLTHKRNPKPAKELRLCATWQPPESSDDLIDLLEVVDYDSSFKDINSPVYRLKAELIWPKGCDPIWQVLKNDTKTSAEFQRKDFIEFCNKFFIELKLPIASKDLLNPGPLEKSVLSLLEEYVGIGRYPNIGRKSEDVAALAVSLATLARTQEATLLSKEISQSLEIRTDYGRVSQAFPVDKRYFHDRPGFRGAVSNALNNNRIHIVTAPPGAGKSWELTRLSEELSKDYIVARHYCYLEPGDELIERRVTTDVFFANIIAELCDADSELGNSSIRMSADLDTLEELLENASGLGKRLVLIIDGLDHISRVRSTSNTLSDDETDIIERLSTIKIPDRVSLVLGSQPGEHLIPLLKRRENDTCSYNLPPWENNDVIDLAKLHHVEQALRSVGINAFEDIEDTLNILASRSDGVPLYARYLCKGLIEAIESGETGNPNDWLLSTPEINGDIAIYYKHLYDNFLRQAQVIADIFGVIDFSVTEDELKEMLPPMILSWLPPALSALSPVLIRVAGQGGIRIFHESFRRFMLDELVLQGRSYNDVLSPVITWLENCGFFSNAKSYRFLLPALRRARRENDIFDYVNTEFVSQSVSNGHPVEAIQKNLAVTAEVAGRMQNWPVLVRCSELRRALSTCFDLGQNSWSGFWTSYANIFGIEVLAERLLFDGRPTLSYEDGLGACLLIDDLGGIPPWSEYLALTADESESSYDNDFDQERYLTTNESINLAAIQGRLRLGGGWRLLRRFYRYLTTHLDNPKICFIRNISRRFSLMGHIDLMEKLARRFDKEDNCLHGFAIKLGVLDAFLKNGDSDLASRLAKEILQIASTPSLAAMCIDSGFIPESLPSYTIDPSSINIGVKSGEGWPEATNIRAWLSSIKFLAYFEQGDEIIRREESRVQGEGWYRCWLRYVLALIKAEVKYKSGLPVDIKSVFLLLTEDVRPFVGEPRACDLYRLHGIIQETLASGLSLISMREDWDHVIDMILTVSSETGTRIDREDGGPVSIGVVIDILLPYASSDVVGEKVYSVIEEEVKTSDNMGTYYSTHAEYTMQLAKVQMALGDFDKAMDSWKSAGVYLAGYGWRKDVTVFDIIDSVSVLNDESKEKALEALEEIQPLVAAVLRHTDGRSTNHAPNSWFDRLLYVDSSSAINLLAKTVLEEDCVESWPTITALKSVAKHVCKNANPILIDALWETLPFEVKYDGEGKSMAKERLDALRPLYNINPVLANDRLLRLAAEAANDTTSYQYEAVVEIKRFALEHDYEIRCAVEPPSKNNPSSDNIDRLNSKPPKSPFEIDELHFPDDAVLVDIMAGLRVASAKSTSLDEDHFKDISLYLSYKLEEMLGSGDEAGARRILHFFAREMAAPLSTKLHPLADLALYLENAGCNSLAAISYALAYTHSRGGGGWYSFGDSSHSIALNKAITLDEELAKQTVADEVSYRLRNTDYGAGISKGLIKRINEWGDPHVAVNCWNEAFDVISHRLPLTSKNTWFATFNANELSSWSTDEGIVSLLLVRLSEPRISRKVASLAGLLKAIKFCPDSVSSPLEWWLFRDTPTTSLLITLQLLLIAELKPYPITNRLKSVLADYARSECWGAAVFASKLLERAGLTAPKSTSGSVDLNHLPVPDAQDIELVFAFDTNDSLKSLSQIDPDLPTKIFKVLSPMLKLDNNIERIKERLKLSYGRDGKVHPPTKVVYWQEELFCSALHSQTQAIYNKLWKNGLWSKDKEFNLLIEAEPDLALPLAKFNSRIPRPDWAEPCELSTGETSLPIVTDDPRYEGWFRLGLVEEQYVTGTHSFSRPEEVIKVFSGAVVAPIGTSTPANYFPFYDGDYYEWWRCEAEEIYQRPHNRYTQLVPLTRHNDLLSDDLVLIPPREILILPGIQPPNFGDKLIWTDREGNPLIACRHWGVKGNQLGGESNSLQGSDLIVRPDIVEMLESLLASPIRLYTDISQSMIRDRK